MKVAVIGNDYKQQFPLLDYGGIESCVENLSIGLHQHYSENIDFSVIVPKILNDGGEEYGFNIIETDFIESSKSGDSTYNFIQQVKGVINSMETKPDIIWAQSHWAGLYLADYAVPVITTIHDSGGWVDNKFIYTPNIYYRFVSKYLYDYVFEDSPKRVDIAQVKDKSFWCHSGLIEEEYEYDPIKDNYILWVGGLHWGMDAKGLNMLVELARILPNENFLVYGTGNDSIAAELINISKELKNFKFMGKLERGRTHIEVFKKAKLFAMLSKIPEAFGRTGLEAISKGTPVIGTMYGSVPEQVFHPNVGFCSNNIDELANAILYQKFDNEKCFQFCRENYHVRNEIDGLITKSLEILSNEN